ncbi:pyruvate formate-lyase-activating protein [Saccharothrix algeriensis]|uniref:Pyruvate formate-lyase-activating enzyme n=1 Tax=Saccharothrix algeriensis TaxID=173560 RepID=A0A8T8I050_9PSEU|nr:pyruvate formate-lyase-activating protein [Saccharothrix algeriensis]MBM7809731.1 pyruvate formate lyase activating enzyme [Saccharothrix algeriensis]QTR04019.1 pyruvate formate lyase-activating protein [Saccharothrix algeriensis]
MTTGAVHSWDLATAVDGPGTRFVVFTAGCPLRCLYCHNPETRFARFGRRVTVDEVVAEIGKYRRFIRVAGGGVTISGGEPLLQPEFTAELLHAVKGLGLHTALDTSGFLGDRATDALLADTDLVLLDIKSWDPATYRHVTGSEVAPTLEFARRLSDLGKPMWIRFVLVPGQTDHAANVEGIASFVATLPSVERVDVLPFHKMGAPKYEALGLPFALADTPTPEAELVERVRGQFLAHGLRA